MRIALMHYHLRPGGVSTVIHDQYNALCRDHECIVLSGEPVPDGGTDGWRASIRVVPEIGYSAERSSESNPRRMADVIRAAMTSAWDGMADILHVHNPTLNKNRGLLRCLRILADGGLRIFAQVHDFAEEGRPGAAYPPDEEYPRDCHYGVINSRDRDTLLSAGLSAEGVHLMFNRVGNPGAAPLPRGGSPARRLLYPVRGIRRKNVGEALLLGVLLDAEVTITLPPRDPADQARFEAWREFAETQHLPARFGAGLSMPLGTLIRESGASVTTSVNEGFGFAFLEPWAAGLEVVGRRVPHVCRDFEEAGLRFPSLYEELPVGNDLFDVHSLARRWRRAVTDAFRKFGREPDPDALERSWLERVRTGSCDFAFLDEEAQREVITRVLSEAAAKRSLESGFTLLDRLRSALVRPDAALVEANAVRVRTSYGEEEYTRLLDGIYRRVVDVRVRHVIDRWELLNRFLVTGRFRMIESR